MRNVCLLLSVIFTAAACGGASSGGYATGAPSTPAAAAPPGAQDDYGYGAAPAASAAPASSGRLQIVDTAKLGKVLAAGSGMTLYLYRQDKPNASTCSGSCAQLWPPFVVSGTPTAPSGLRGTLGLLTRTDGAKQVTYNGLPLYLFSGDQRPGDANGDGLDGLWSAVKNP